MAGRTRRSTQAVRTEMLRAAQQVFGERGYANTSTKEIAARAQVSEPLLFRHYGSKAQLFEQAILEPLDAFIASYTERWNAEPVHDGEAGDLARAYVGGLYDMLERNRGIFMAAVAARAHEDHLDGQVADANPALDGLFARLEELVRKGWAEQGWTMVDPALAVRLTFGLVMSAAVFDDWLFASGDRPSRDALVQELTDYMLHGLTDRPAPRRSRPGSISP